MIVSMILKMIFFYFLYKLIRGTFRTYQIFGQLKGQRAHSTPAKAPQGGDIIEAEFKVLKK